MEKTYKLKSGNKIVLRVGEIEEEKGDAILNWTSLSMDTGPDEFYKINRKGGPQVMSAMRTIQPYVNYGDVVSTIAGLLDYNLLLHAIYPPPTSPTIYELIVFNAINTIKEYQSKGNICRDLTLTLLNNEAQLLNGIFDYENKLENFSFIFIIPTTKEFVIKEKVFDKRFREGLLSKISNLFYKFNI